MRRKDGKPKRKAKRNLPEFTFGFRKNPNLPDCGLQSEAHLAQASYSVASLFAGCGGLDLGITGGFNFLGATYNPLPFHVVCAIDNSEDAIKTYQLNLGNHTLLADLSKLDIEKIPSADILMGGFPCQDFSSSGTKQGFKGKRGQLYNVLTDYINFHQPKIVIGENVPHLARLKGGVYLETILKEFESAGYSFDVWDLYAPDYGLPQSRRRLFLIGVRNDLIGFPIQPQPTHKNKYVTIDEALTNLESITDEAITNQSQYFVATRASSGGGQGDHTNQAGKVAYCIRANSRGRIQFHYKLPRRLTVRECARLQSFPDEFVFPFSTQRNMTLIGNAVPPLLAHHVAKSISNYLQTLSAFENNSDPQPKTNGLQGLSLERSRARQLSLIELP